MDPDHWLQPCLYVVFLLFSAFFSAAEGAYARANTIRLRSLSEDGDKRAGIALRIVEDFDRSLTTILVGNNIANIGCASLAAVFALDIYEAMRAAGSGVSEGAVTAVATVITTLIVLFFSELTPKNYAKCHSEKLALAFARPTRALTILLAPISIVFRGISHLMSRLFGGGKTPTITEEELSTIIEDVEEQGDLDESQGKLLQSALEFSRNTVSDVLTLREDMVTLPITASVQEVYTVVRDSSHSRIPVYEGDTDHIIGILPVRSFLRAYIREKTADVRSLLLPPFYVEPDRPIDGLLDVMRQARTSMAIVKDENGHVCGLVTMEDLLEELVGEIWDEEDVVNENFSKLGGGRFEMSASFSPADAFRLMKYTPPDGKLPSRRPFCILVPETLGHAPEQDERWEEEDLVYTASTVEKGHLVRLTIKISNPPPDPEEEDTEEEASSRKEEASSRKVGEAV